MPILKPQPFNPQLMMDALDPFSPRHDEAHTAWRNSLTPNICCYSDDINNNLSNNSSNNLDKEGSSVSSSRNSSISYGPSNDMAEVEEQEERSRRRRVKTNNKKGVKEVDQDGSSHQTKTGLSRLSSLRRFRRVRNKRPETEVM
ncbi:hypothetical protein ACA910_012431 [Epithemia clementina (nom. ined.)]